MKTKRKIKRKRKSLKRKKSQKGGRDTRVPIRPTIARGARSARDRSTRDRTSTTPHLAVQRDEPLRIFQDTIRDHCHIDSDDLPHKYTETREVRGGWGIPIFSPYVQQEFIVDPIDDETLRNIRDYNIRNCIIHKVRLNDNGSTELIKSHEVIPLGGQETITSPWSPEDSLSSENIFAIPYDEPNILYYFSLHGGEANRCYAVSRDDSTYHENHTADPPRYFHARGNEPEERNVISGGDIFLRSEIAHNCLVKGRDVIIAGKIIKVRLRGIDIFIVTNSSGHYIPIWNDHSIYLIKRFFNVGNRLVIVNNRMSNGHFLQGYQYLHGGELLDDEEKGRIKNIL